MSARQNGELALSASCGPASTCAVFQFFAKVIVEVVFTPLTYLVVGALKRAEHEDYYDRDTNFNPFVLEEKR